MVALAIANVGGGGGQHDGRLVSVAKELLVKPCRVKPQLVGFDRAGILVRGRGSMMHNQARGCGGGVFATSSDCELISVCGLVRVIDLLVY